MMKAGYFLLISTVFSLLFVSCDRDDEGEMNAENKRENSRQFEPEIFSQEKDERGEAFTSIITREKCSICGSVGHPEFDKELEEKERVNGISIQYKESDPYTTEYGMDLAQFYTVSGTPTLISGLEKYTSNTLQEWKTTNREAVESTPRASVWFSEVERSKSIEGEVSVEFFEAVDAVTSVVVYLTESGLVGPQTTYDGVVEDYVHNHVLREAPFGNGGREIASSDKGNVTSFPFMIEDISDYVPARLRLVAVLYELDGGTPVRAINSRTLELF